MNVSFAFIGLVAVFGHFLFYQQYHCKNFKGASTGAELLVCASAFFAALFFYGFLGYWLIKVNWQEALIAYMFNLAISFAWYALEAKLNLRRFWWCWSLAGFVALPVTGYLLIMMYLSNM